MMVLYGEFMPRARTYALGVQVLCDSYGAGECPLQSTAIIEDKRWVRPLTFAENLRVHVNQ